MIMKMKMKMKLQMKTQMKKMKKNNFKHFQSVARCESYNSNASEPEPSGDGKRELGHDPSGEFYHGRSERRLSQETAKKEHREKQHHKKRKQKAQQRKETERKTNTKQEHNTTHGRASKKPLFDIAMGSSDAELRVGLKLSGVPPWETQRESTNELTGSNLVEHERLETHP